MELTKQKVQIVIEKNGEFTLTAGEGFSGESCQLKRVALSLFLAALKSVAAKRTLSTTATAKHRLASKASPNWSLNCSIIGKDGVKA